MTQIPPSSSPPAAEAPPRVQIPRKPPKFPPPSFPPHRPKLFARMPPAVFPVILGLLGLGLALRRAVAALGSDTGLAMGLVDLALGLAVGLWVFAALGLAIKIGRRPGVILEDLRVVPGRAGLATASMGAMAAALALAPVQPGLALALLWLGLLGHLTLLALFLRLLWSLPAEARGVDPSWHLLWTGSILGGLPALALGVPDLALGLFGMAVLTASVVWAVSALQLLRRVPPAPLRPLLAVHLAPAALLSVTAGGLGWVGAAQGFAVLALVMFVGLLLAARWILAAGFSAVWGAFTFPVTALASCLIALPRGGLGDYALGLGVAVLILALGVVPGIAWTVLKQWPGGKLAGKTNAAEA